ncbi:hypothetical protein MIN45_P0016 [Methylomarinovum tepidoasis]|uniref:Uncharacterized protein n=1 Tax=Methylomarinovum tepidoasis TaxID=2840183 RepID=A0AAU9C3L8_9GAMM|nr:hypothetical protein [Methylomarinovum sp. IN45]BCX87649.1 hypothetical protein MIN45_P0016 [Methylomarinovum sp. IN45]
MGTATVVSHPARKTSTTRNDTGTAHPPECFQSDQRYFCRAKCPWSRRCKKLIAEWLR